jgi:hypothetical protein
VFGSADKEGSMLVVLGRSGPKRLKTKV